VAETLPFLFAAAGLTVLYKGVPARHVAAVPALIAGALAAAALEVAKHAFGWYLAKVSTYEAVYGALAVLPSFLVWIYLCWIIILTGAAVCAAIADPGSYRIQIRIAELGAERTRCDLVKSHAMRAHDLFPAAAEPAHLLASCGVKLKRR